MEDFFCVPPLLPRGEIACCNATTNGVDDLEWFGVNIKDRLYVKLDILNLLLNSVFELVAIFSELGRLAVVDVTLSLEEELLSRGIKWVIVGEATGRGLLTLLVVSTVVGTPITITERVRCDNAWGSGCGGGISASVLGGSPHPSKAITEDVVQLLDSMSW
ncbi:hypothetical protein ACLOJK_026866 [Asimina triloba]